MEGKENTGLKRTFKELLTESLERTDEKSGKTRQEMLIDAMVDKAIAGDARAFEIVRGIAGADEANTLVIYLEEDADELAG